MQNLFAVVLVAAAAFVWLTSSGLPEVVATHFGADGAADHFMNRPSYTVLMLALTIAVPLFVATFSRLLPPSMINLPNKRHWLAPERQAASLAALSAMSLRFALAMVAFLCGVHWLVVQANAVQPPRLAAGWLYVALAAFGAATVAWVLGLFGRFPRAG